MNKVLILIVLLYSCNQSNKKVVYENFEICDGIGLPITSKIQNIDNEFVDERIYNFFENDTISSMTINSIVLNEDLNCSGIYAVDSSLVVTVSVLNEKAFISDRLRKNLLLSLQLRIKEVNDILFLSLNKSQAVMKNYRKRDFIRINVVLGYNHKKIFVSEYYFNNERNQFTNIKFYSKSELNFEEEISNLTFN